MTRALAASIVVTTLIACGPPSAVPRRCGDSLESCPPDKDALISGTDLERYFPMVEGYVYQYRVESETDAGADTGVLSMSMRRKEKGAGEIVVGNVTKRIELTGEGVAQTSPGPRTFLLKAPIADGASWTSGNGARVEIVRAKTQKAVPAGTFDDCVEVKETRPGSPPQIIVTTYCSGVGMVTLDTAAGAARVVASLVYYGPRIDLGEDGVKRVE